MTVTSLRIGPIGIFKPDSNDLENPDFLPGHIHNLTADQKLKLDTFRRRVKDEGYTQRTDSRTLLRYLRARKWDLQKAHTMFTDAEKWRVDFGVEELERTFNFQEREQVFKYYPQYYHKTDKAGRPVFIEQLDKIDVPALYKITTPERLLKNLVIENERFENVILPGCSCKRGHPVETSNTILDLKNVTLKQVASVYGYIQESSKIGQNYYPERMERFFMVNSPFGFSACWAIIKRFLDPRTVEKVFILGSDFQSALLQHIPKENLPKRFGGTCECPGGCELSDAGPWKDVDIKELELFKMEDSISVTEVDLEDEDGDKFGDRLPDLAVVNGLAAVR